MRQKVKEYIEQKRLALESGRPVYEFEPKSEVKLCISCKHRVARKNSVLCSRCTGKELQNKVRDTLPGFAGGGEATEQEQNKVVSAPSDAEVRTPPLSNEPPAKYYTRKEIAGLLNISCTTMYRWEKKGKVPMPLKVARTGQLLYIEEVFQQIKKFAENIEVREARPPVAQQTSGLKFVNKKISRAGFNRSLERTVSTRLGRAGKLI